MMRIQHVAQKFGAQFRCRDGESEAETPTLAPTYEEGIAGGGSLGVDGDVAVPSDRPSPGQSGCAIPDGRDGLHRVRSMQLDLLWLGAHGSESVKGRPSWA
jgi:hypothetical protein